MTRPPKGSRYPDIESQSVLADGLVAAILIDEQAKIFEKVAHAPVELSVRGRTCTSRYWPSSCGIY